METQELAALKRAIAKAGGQSALARACGVKQGHVWHWLNKACRVPAEHVLAVEAASAGTVTRYELRPDIFDDTRALARQPQGGAGHEARANAGAATGADAGIVAQIASLEGKQHRAVREALLNRSGAADRLARLDNAIAALRAVLESEAG